VVYGEVPIESSCLGRIARAWWQKESVIIPPNAVLDALSRHSATLEGKVGVYWEERHYSVSLKDLLTKTEVTRTACGNFGTLRQGLDRI
jgi:hypothetical protein